MQLTIASHSISVIYLFRNKVNGKIYVGSSKNLYRRFKYGYEWKARADKAPERGIEYAIKRWGIEGFNLEILEHVPDITQLVTREQYWMDTLQPFSPNGYNWSRKAGNGRTKTGWGHKASDELCELRRQSALKHVDALLARRQKSVYKIDPITLTVIDKYVSAIAADRNNKYVEGSVSKACRSDGPAKMFGGFYWCYQQVYDSIGFVKPGPSFAKRAVKQLTESGDIITVWPTIKDAAKSVEAVPGLIRRCCNGKRKHCRGYKWAFVEPRL